MADLQKRAGFNTRWGFILWVMKKEDQREAISYGIKKPIGEWFFVIGKIVYCACALVALIAGAKLGGIG